MTIALQLARNFDHVVWQTCRAPLGGSALLLTWEITPEPVDGGIPEMVAQIFAEALLAIGVVAYGGDAGEARGRPIKVQVRRGLRRRELCLYQADCLEDLIPAFASGTHDWSQNNQWLLVTRPSVSDESLLAAAQALYGEWVLPKPWPDEVILIVQAAVDGDGAACFTVDRAIEQQFVAALVDRAGSAKIEVSVPPHQPN